MQYKLLNFLKLNMPKKIKILIFYKNNTFTAKKIKINNGEKNQSSSSSGIFK